MNKPVLVFVFSSQCGACINFKRQMLPELEKELANDSRFTYTILDFPTMQIPNSMPNMKFHPELKNGFVKFFPTLMLVPGNIWNNTKSKLKAVVKHGDQEIPKVDYSKNGILSWINETITKNSMFTSNTNSNPLPKSEDGRYVVPTYGQFRHSKIDESEKYQM